jgi:DNA-binding beta-propeller fold protein YncE
VKKIASRSGRLTLAALLSATAALVSVSAATASVPAPPRIVAHFDIAAGQTPENAVVLPDGSTDVTFAMANQVAHVARDGKVTVLAQLPPTGKCGIFPGPATLGIARAHDGTLFVAECSGTPATGIWRVRPGSAPVQVAELPSGGFPNGMALDDRNGELYVADSALGTIWKVPARGGAPTAWATGPSLAELSFAGANGLVIHGNAVWAGNLDKGIIVRMPIRGDGSAGPAELEATGLNGGLDDFSVIGRNTIVATLNMADEVVQVQPGQPPQVLLTAADGLSTPTSVRLRNDTIYVTSAAYFTGTDPNLLVTHLRR